MNSKTLISPVYPVSITPAPTSIPFLTANPDLGASLPYKLLGNYTYNPVLISNLERGYSVTFSILATSYPLSLSLAFVNY